MQITVSGRHMGVSAPLKEYCEEKSAKLTRYYDRIQSIEIILDGRDGRHAVEIIVHTERTTPFVATEQHEDAYAAVDLLIDKIERQLTRHKEKLRNRKHPRMTHAEAAQAAAEALETQPRADENEEEPQ